jgi:cyclopropane fatty-acyl-phospholipid synthase-like methyltransferase
MKETPESVNENQQTWYSFIAPFVAGAGSYTVYNTRWHQDIAKLDKDQSVVVNLHRVNDIKGINTFFRKVNSRLKAGGRFVGCMETLENRKERLYKKYPPVINRMYYAADFVLKRVFPKLSLTHSLYFALTQGRNRALSKAEILGRVVYCGCSIEAVTVSDNVR